MEELKMYGNGNFKIIMMKYPEKEVYRIEMTDPDGIKSVDDNLSKKYADAIFAAGILMIEGSGK